MLSMRLPSRLGLPRLLQLCFQIFLTYSPPQLEFNTPTRLVNPLTRECRQPESPHLSPLVKTRNTYSLMLFIQISLSFMYNRVNFIPRHRSCLNVKSMLAALDHLLRKSSTILVTTSIKHLLFKGKRLMQLMAWISLLVVIALEMAQEARKWMRNTSRRCTVHRVKVNGAREPNTLRIMSIRKMVNRTIGAFRPINSPNLFRNRSPTAIRHPKWRIIDAKGHRRTRQKENSNSHRGNITTTVAVSTPPMSTSQLRMPASSANVTSSSWGQEKMSVADSVSHRMPRLTITRPVVRNIFRESHSWKNAPQTKNRIERKFRAYQLKVKNASEDRLIYSDLW